MVRPSPGNGAVSTQVRPRDGRAAIASLRAATRGPYDLRLTNPLGESRAAAHAVRPYWWAKSMKVYARATPFGRRFVDAGAGTDHRFGPD